jgi:hypothetical protein
MAKKASKAAAPASASVNKSQAIRDALAANPDKMPKEITEILASQGLKVSPAFVSIIKSKAKGKARPMRVIVRRKVRVSVPSATPMTAALEFIRSAGGLSQAKSILDTVEQIRAAL